MLTSVPEWMDRAFCRHAGDGSLWLSDDREDQALAVKLCHECPVMRECRAYYDVVEGKATPTYMFTIVGGEMPRTRFSRRYSTRTPPPDENAATARLDPALRPVDESFSCEKHPDGGVYVSPVGRPECRECRRERKAVFLEKEKVRRKELRRIADLANAKQRVTLRA